MLNVLQGIQISFPNKELCEKEQCPIQKIISKIKNPISAPPLPPTPIKAQTINEKISLEIE